MCDVEMELTISVLIARTIVQPYRTRAYPTPCQSQAFTLRSKVETMVSVEGTTPYSRTTWEQATSSGNEYFQHQVRAGKGADSKPDDMVQTATLIPRTYTRTCIHLSVLKTRYHVRLSHGPVQRGIKTAAIKTSQRQNGESKDLRKQVNHFKAFSHEDSWDDCEKVVQRVDNRRPSVEQTHRW